MCCCTLRATFTFCFIDAKLLEGICIFFLKEHVSLSIYTLIQVRKFIVEFVNILNTNTAGISGFSRCVNDISLFLDVKQRVLVISYRRLGTTFLPHLQESSSPRSYLLGLQTFKQSSVKKSKNLSPLTACPLEGIYRLSRNVDNQLPSTLRNIAEDRRSNTARSHVRTQNHFI
jgi:hypothetical protein